MTLTEDRTMAENCVNCGAETDGDSAVWTSDDNGESIKWPLCHQGPSPTCYEKWTGGLPRTTAPISSDQATYARWWVILNCWMWPSDLPGRPATGNLKDQIRGAHAVVDVLLDDEGRAEVDRLWNDDDSRARVLHRAV